MFFWQIKKNKIELTWKHSGGGNIVIRLAAAGGGGNSPPETGWEPGTENNKIIRFMYWKER